MINFTMEIKYVTAICNKEFLSPGPLTDSP